MFKKFDENKIKIQSESKKLINSFGYAFTGIGTAVKSERNMKIHCIMMALVIFFGIILKISKLEWIICIALFGLVIGAEMFNTAIEYVVDLASPEKNDLAKHAKDVAAGAVLVNAIAAAIIGFLIFVPKILIIMQNIR